MSRIRPLSTVTIATAVIQVTVIFCLYIATAFLPLFILLLQSFLNRVTLLNSQSGHVTPLLTALPLLLTKHTNYHSILVKRQPITEVLATFQTLILKNVAPNKLLS